MKLTLFATFALLSTTIATVQDPPSRRHPTGHEDQGLPHSAAVWAPYHAEPDHRLNRIFRAIFLAELQPAVVAGALPREHGLEEGFLVEGWVHTKREGTPDDHQLYGGDGRQLPREGFEPLEAERFRAELVALSKKDLAAFEEQPELAVLFQHDLLKLARRLTRTGDNPELLAPLARAARLVALSPEKLERLNNPLASAKPTGLLRYPKSEFREVLRRSTRLFNAEYSLLWSRLYLQHPDGPEALAALLPKADSKTKPQVPIGFRAILEQGIVAWASDGTPHATNLILDYRQQALVNRDPLSWENPSFTGDGIDFDLVLLEREGLRSKNPARFYRVVDPEDQELFRDYGSLKHTTYRAQCSLCHRNTGTPEPELGGFSVLRPNARARFAESGDERLRLAEEEAARFFATLK